MLEYTVEHHTSTVGGVGLVVKETLHESTGQFPEVTVRNLLTEHLAKRRVILQGGYKHQGYSCYCVCYTARSLSTNHTDPHQLKIPPHQQRPSPPLLTCTMQPCLATLHTISTAQMLWLYSSSLSFLPTFPRSLTRVNSAVGSSAVALCFSTDKASTILSALPEVCVGSAG